MNDAGTDQHIARAVEDNLAYTRGRVREMREQLGRIKQMAERIARECDSFLTGKDQPDEEPF